MYLLFRWIIRPVLTFILGLVVVVAVGILTVDWLVSGKLLNADFYADIISQQDTYNRIYDEVLLEDDVRRASGELFPTGLVSHEDIVGILRDIAPPEYLREQVEGVIDAIIGYLRDSGNSETEDAEELRIYVDLGPPLERVEPVAVGYIQERIDRIPEEQAEPPECTPARVVQLGERYSDLYDEISAARAPGSIPSIKGLTQPCREFVFDAAFGAPELTMPFGGGGLLAHADLDAVIVRGLRENEEAIRAEFVAGNTREALKAAVLALALEAVVEESIDRIPEEEPKEAPEEASDCSPARLAQLGERYGALYRQVAAGEAPASIPSAGTLSQSCRESVFDSVFGSPGAADSLLARGGLDPSIVQGLQERQEEIRREFVAGNTKEALKAAAPMAAVSVGDALDQIPEEGPGEPGCSPAGLVELGERYAAVYDEIAADATPASMPSAKALTRPCREFVFDAVFGAPKLVMPFDGGLLAHGGLDPRVVQGLRESEEELRTEFVAGNTREALKVAAPAVVSPLLGDEIERFRAEALDADDRMELIGLTGEQTAAEIRADADELRTEFAKWRKTGRAAGIGLLVGGVVLLLLLHLPDVSRGLRRVGVSLVVAGLVYLGVTKLLLPRIGLDITGLMNEVTGTQPDIPESLARLIQGILVSVINEVTLSLDDLAIPALIAGVAVFAASYAVPLGRRLVSRSEE